MVKRRMDHDGRRMSPRIARERNDAQLKTVSMSMNHNLSTCVPSLRLIDPKTRSGFTIQNGRFHNLNRLSDPDRDPDLDQIGCDHRHLWDTRVWFFFKSVRQSIFENWAKMLKNVLSRHVKRSWKKILHPDRDPDHHQKLMRSTISRFTRPPTFLERSDRNCDR